MAAAAYYFEIWLRSGVPGTALPIQIFRVVATIAASLAVLSVSASLLRLHEFEEARGMVLRRFKRLAR